MTWNIIQKSIGDACLSWNGLIFTTEGGERSKWKGRSTKNRIDCFWFLETFNTKWRGNRSFSCSTGIWIALFQLVASAWSLHKRGSSLKRDYGSMIIEVEEEKLLWQWLCLSTSRLSAHSIIPCKLQWNRALCCICKLQDTRNIFPGRRIQGRGVKTWKYP